jgi:hypothetical protein
MESKDIKFIILIALGVYLLFSYILGYLNPFESNQFTRLVEVGVFVFLVAGYFQIKE